MSTERRRVDPAHGPRLDREGRRRSFICGGGPDESDRVGGTAPHPKEGAADGSPDLPAGQQRWLAGGIGPIGSASPGPTVGAVRCVGGLPGPDASSAQDTVRGRSRCTKVDQHRLSVQGAAVKDHRHIHPLSIPHRGAVAGSGTKEITRLSPQPCPAGGLSGGASLRCVSTWAVSPSPPPQYRPFREPLDRPTLSGCRRSSVRPNGQGRLRRKQLRATGPLASLPARSPITYNGHSSPRR